MADISFILVNYFSEDLSMKCIQTIVKNSTTTNEIILVDNNSGMNANRLKASRAGLMTIQNDKNLGYGLACDVASKMTRNKYLFFLNNDAEIVENAVNLLQTYLDAHPDVALVGPQLINLSGKPVPSFDYFPTISSKIFGIDLHRFFWPSKYPKKDTATTTEVDLIAGAAMFIRADVYREIGGFDSQYFLYCEEEDLAMRVHKAGYKVVFVPEAKVMHVGGGSSKDKPGLKKEFYISFFKFYRKHYGWFKTQVLKLICFNQFILRYLFRDEKEIWGPIIKWFLRGAPESESLRYRPGNIDGPPLVYRAEKAKEGAV